MTSIKARLNRSRVGRDGRYPLVIQIIKYRKKRELYTPFRLKETEFDPENEMAVVHGYGKRKERAETMRKVNEYLSYMKEELLDLESALAQKKDYSAEDLVQAYRSRKDMRCYFSYASHKIEELKANKQNGTAANYQSALNAFERYLGRCDIKTDELTLHLIEGFISALKKAKKSPNTINFYIQQLRAIYNKADEDGYVQAQTNPFKKVSAKGSKTIKRAISKEHVVQISSLDLSGKHPHLELARDLWMFSFYCRGMAFVDMCYLKKENIMGDTISYHRHKTGQLLQIKIEAPLQNLILKYRDKASEYLLPMLRENDSYQGYRYIQRCLNKRIKKIGVMIGHDVPLTFYVARHTWATLARDKGISVSIISEGMGHTSEKTTYIYLGSFDHNQIDRANRIVMNYCMRDN